ncbi:hypothetical protein SAMN04488573_1204 [Bacillus sp. 5mfcol3.1]|uniref:hypothetical protein n=1 Tax=Bacillus TaxID=1386 RepID=UPI0008F06E50|nr:MULTISPECIES: hypothetical protein [Bacillus]MED3486108.1 hypothetical protein [Bacillus toyonensis]SFM29598.1 hypothetical protein SAMN04488573_1204 [Bacillus sp. 5mfcol3.1]
MVSSIDYKVLYEELLTNQQIPGTSYLNATRTKYEIRDLFVDLGEVFKSIEDSKLTPSMISIFADVVRIPNKFRCTLKDMQLVIRARRVEIQSEGTAEILLDYKNGGKLAQLTIYGIELSGVLHATPIYNQSSPPPYSIELKNKGVRLSDKDGIFTAEEITHVVPTPQLPKLFISVFQVACLFFESRPDIAANQLNWLKIFTTQYDGLTSLCVQSTSLLAILTANRGDNTFVPLLDKELYRDEINAFLGAAQQFEAQYHRYLDKNLSIEDRKNAALLMLKHEQDTLLFKETLINQAKNNLKNSRDAIETSLRQFEKQQHVLTLAKIEFEYGLKKYEYEQQMRLAFKMVSTVLNFAQSMGSIIASGGASAPGEIIGIINALKEIIEAGGELSALAQALKENMEKLNDLVELINKVYTLAEDISEASGDMQFPDDLFEKIKDTEWDIPQEDLTGKATWDIFKLKTAAALDDAIKKEIEGARAYLLELDILAVYGQTLASIQVAVISCGQELFRLLIEKHIHQADLARLEEYIRNLEGQESENEEMEQKLYQRYIDMKQILFVALANYKHAYKYWALRDSDVNPNILKDVSELKVDVATIQTDCMQALKQFNPPPQRFQNRIVEITDSKVLESLKEQREASWEINLNDTLFENEYRVRLKLMRIWLDGIDATSKVQIRITNSGHYYDNYMEKKFQFNSESFNRGFSYQGTTIITDGIIADEFAYDYFIPNPYTTWTIKVQDGPDLSNVTKIRMELAGSLVTNYKKNNLVLNDLIESV